MSAIGAFQPEAILARESREERIYWSIGGLFSQPLVRYAIKTECTEDVRHLGLSFKEQDNETVWTVSHDGRFLNMVARAHGVGHLATWPEGSVANDSCITNLEVLVAWLHQFWDLVEARYALRGELR